MFFYAKICIIERKLMKELLMITEAKILIEALKLQKEKIRFQIDKVAESAMEKEGVKIPHVNIATGEKVEGLYDDMQWFKIGEWDCDKSPFGYCMYHRIADPSKDSCVFCKQPHERK